MKDSASLWRPRIAHKGNVHITDTLCIRNEVFLSRCKRKPLCRNTEFSERLDPVALSGEDKRIVKIEVPRGYTETYVVELPYGDNLALRKDFVNALQIAGFFHQTIRQRCNY